MKRTLRFLAFPALALASTYSGTVVDLAGRPLQGISIRSATDSTISSAGGAWSLGGVNGVRSRSATTVSVTSHLVLDGGRPRLVFAGADASGRAKLNAARGPVSQASARAAVAIETGALNVFWRGKRLVVLPVSRLDSSGIEFRIDTAWSDDQGFAWNPRVAYGSVRDVKWPQVYRTVSIGSQTWMAENLNASVAKTGTQVGSCYDDGKYSNCDIYGGLYTFSWVDTDTATGNSPVPLSGLCPTGWHFPSDSEWTLLETTLVGKLGVNPDSVGSALLNRHFYLGQDRVGFRVMLGGYQPYFPVGDKYQELGITATFWTATMYPGIADYKWLRVLSASDPKFHRTKDYIGVGYSIRCLKD